MQLNYDSFSFDCSILKITKKKPISDLKFVKNNLYFRLDENKDDVNMYVASMESPKLEKNSSHQYIVMKPKHEIVKTNKL